jgi:hypothetical protein
MDTVWLIDCGDVGNNMYLSEVSDTVFSPIPITIEAALRKGMKVC